MLLTAQISFEAQQHDSDIKVAQETLVNDIFGSDDVNPRAELPPMEKIVVLFWLFREDAAVVRYLATLIETHVMASPCLLEKVATCLPSLAQLALQWEPLQKIQDINLLERLLLIMAQLSTRFAVQYHWNLQCLLREHQPENARSSFDVTKYARCMKLTGNLERCMSGAQKPEETPQAAAPMLEIVATHGGKVTNDEKHDMRTVEEEEETNHGFFDVIVKLADENASQFQHSAEGSNDLAAHAELPMKNSFGGVLQFKRQHRKAGRRKTWKKRYFAIEESMLNCYSRERTLLRSISLQGATLWKGPQKKHPHSFILANDDTMFFLQASSIEQKSLWKRKLRDVIDDSGPADGLSETQKQRYNKYQRGKWFGRTMIEMSKDLEGVAPEDRREFLYEHCFDLEIPSDVYWPWQDSNGHGPDKHVFVVLPHFSRPLSGSSSFQASFILNNDDDTTTESASAKFLQEGRQEPNYMRLKVPNSFVGILEDMRQRKRNPIGCLMLKDIDGGYTTGESTDELSSDSSDGSSVEESTSWGSTSNDVDQELDMASTYTADGTCDSNESTDFSTCESVPDDEIELDFDDDVSLCRESMNCSVELVLAGTDIPPKAEPKSRNKTESSVKKEDRDKSSLSDDAEFSNADEVKFSILPRTTKGLVSLRTKPYVTEEMIAVHLGKYYESLFEDSKIWLRPPIAQRLGIDTVIVELPRKAITIAEAKKTHGGRLINYFVEAHGPVGSSAYEKAQMCFTQSLAGLSLFAYLLGIKNRHDGNFMIDEEGHIFAADLSCVLGSDPGGISSAIEVAPFKLTKEYLQILGGQDSECFKHFCDLFVLGLKTAHADGATAIGFAKVASGSSTGRRSVKASRYLKEKLLVDTPEQMLEAKARALIERSQQNLMTSAYDALSKSKSSVGVEV